MRRFTLAFSALLMVLAACSTVGEPTSTTAAWQTSPPSAVGTGGQSAQATSGSGGQTAIGVRVNLAEASLYQFEACADFLSYVKAHALDRVTAYGLDGWGYWPYWTGRDGALVEGAVPVTTAVPAQTTVAPESPGRAIAEEDAFSGTNVQERGVDEPDLVKTDGRRIVTLVDGTLSVVDVTGEAPRLVGRIDVADVSVHDMFLHGDTVLLMGTSWGGRISIDPVLPVEPGVEFDALPPWEPYGTPNVTLLEVDISAEPELGRSLIFDGSYLSGRMIDGVVRIASFSGPTGFPWVFPEADGLRAEREALEANRALIETSTIDNWVPYYVLADSDGNVIDEGAAIDCSRAHHPEAFAGLNMLSVTTIDLSRGLEIVDSTGVLSNGETVYASHDAMYIATNRWIDWRLLESSTVVDEDALDEQTTEIHKFAINGTRTDYVASGSVRGTLLNQFAMSEHEGDLRVASTTWGRGDRQESLVTVLRPAGESLERIGEVDGLGEGEQIYSVRFMGDVAYVVTFRQVDPLYTLDLTDPANPIVRGELKIPGYSSYLHPLDDDYVVGVGQHATDRGRIRGSQIALFDVSDLDDPRRVDWIRFGVDTNSTAEHDHRAFLQWGDLLVVPLTEYGWSEGKGESFFSGAVGVRIGDGTLTEIAKITHPGGDAAELMWEATIMRSLVIDDALYTVSPAGILKSDLDTLADEAWLAF